MSDNSTQKIRTFIKIYQEYVMMKKVNTFTSFPLVFISERNTRLILDEIRTICHGYDERYVGESSVDSCARLQQIIDEYFDRDIIAPSTSLSPDDMSILHHAGVDTYLEFILRALERIPKAAPGAENLDVVRDPYASEPFVRSIFGVDIPRQ